MNLPEDIRGLPALSIRQPWCEAILRGKDCENRSWHTNFRGRFLIHASKTFEVADYLDLRDEFPRFPDRADIPMGGIVGIATCVDCVDRHPSMWFCGPYAMILEDAERLPFIPCSGRLGFFRPELPAE